MTSTTQLWRNSVSTRARTFPPTVWWSSFRRSGSAAAVSRVQRDWVWLRFKATFRDWAWNRRCIVEPFFKIPVFFWVAVWGDVLPNDRILINYHFKFWWLFDHVWNCTGQFLLCFGTVSQFPSVNSQPGTSFSHLETTMQAIRWEWNHVLLRISAIALWTMQNIYE